MGHEGSIDWSADIVACRELGGERNLAGQLMDPRRRGARRDRLREDRNVIRSVQQYVLLALLSRSASLVGKNYPTAKIGVGSGKLAMIVG
jgi:hypothetical protein